MKGYPVKYSVKVLTINKAKQKINFQIRHPENASEITGIAVTCDLKREPSDGLGLLDKGQTSGCLTLSLPQKGDVVFAEDVRIDEGFFSDILEKIIYGANIDFFWQGKTKPYFETSYKIDKAILEGFYEDIYIDPPIPGGALIASYYKVRVYIRYKMKDQIIPSQKK